MSDYQERRKTNHRSPTVGRPPGRQRTERGRRNNKVKRIFRRINSKVDLKLTGEKIKIEAVYCLLSME